MVDSPSGNPKEAMLVLQVCQAPRFFMEINPQPKKNTLWTPCEDFTGGEALASSRHCIIARRAFLKRHCEKLKQSNPEFGVFFDRGIGGDAPALSDSLVEMITPRMQVDLNPAVLRAARISGIDLDSPFWDNSTTPTSSLSAYSDVDSPRFQPVNLPGGFDFDPSCFDNAALSSLPNPVQPIQNISPFNAVNVGHASQMMLQQQQQQHPVIQGIDNYNNSIPAPPVFNYMNSSWSSPSFVSSQPAQQVPITTREVPVTTRANSGTWNINDLSILREKNPSLKRVVADSQLDSFSFQKGYHSS